MTHGLQYCMGLAYHFLIYDQDFYVYLLVIQVPLSDLSENFT